MLLTKKDSTEKLFKNILNASCPLGYLRVQNGP